MNSAGSVLPQNTKQFMESRFGADFSDVRIHTDNNAAHLNDEMDAMAFTYGKDIYFNKERFNPETSSGRHLLAHELTHTIQQTGIIRRKEGEGHDLTSPEMLGDSELEAVFDSEKVFKNGASGDHIKKLQNALIKAGFSLPKFGADGTYGNETTNAVIKFQTASGLTGIDIDGIVGKKTIGLLDMSSRHGATEKDTDKKEDDFKIKGKFSGGKDNTTQVYFDLGKFDLDKDEKDKLDKLSGKLTPVKVTLKGFASEEGTDSVNKKLIDDRIKAVSDYLGPKLASGIGIEKKPALEEGKGQVHYREFRSVIIIQGEDKEVKSECGKDAPVSEPCPAPFDELKDAVKDAVDLINKAKKELPPTKTETEKLLFEDLFRPSNPKDKAEKDKIVKDVSDIFDKMIDHINKMTNPGAHVCATACDGGCQSGSPAYNSDTQPDPAKPVPNPPGVTFFCPSFKKEDKKQRAIIIIHEGHHGVPGIKSGDVAYRSTRLIKIIDKDQALQNASSFEMFVKLIDDPKSGVVGPEESDELKGAITSTETNDINEAIAWLEQWFSLVTFDTSVQYAGIVKVRNKKSWVFDTDTESAFFKMKDIFAPRFNLTMPPTFPIFNDQKAIAAVNDRLETMEKALNKKLTIEKITTGKDSWENGPGTKITVTTEFFTLPPSKMLIALLQELVHAVPDISASLEPEYVILVNQLRSARNLGGPKK